VLARELSGPLNVLATRDGPTPHELGTAGATPITFGGGLMERASDAVRDMARELRGV
jgi:hypothetical protein